MSGYLEFAGDIGVDHCNCRLVVYDCQAFDRILGVRSGQDHWTRSAIRLISATVQ